MYVSINESNDTNTEDLVEITNKINAPFTRGGVIDKEDDDYECSQGAGRDVPHSRGGKK